MSQTEKLERLYKEVTNRIQKERQERDLIKEENYEEHSISYFTDKSQSLGRSEGLVLALHLIKEEMVK